MLRWREEIIEHEHRFPKYTVYVATVNDFNNSLTQPGYGYIFMDFLFIL